MTLKQGVRIGGIRPEIVLAMFIADGLRAGLVITSVKEGQHAHKSLHYAGAAFDIRTRDWPPPEIGNFRDKLAAALGSSDFDVLIEKDHIHVEFQPTA